MSATLRSLTALTCTLALHTALHAQRYDPHWSPPRDNWPHAQQRPFLHDVEVITIYQPGVRHDCRAIAIDDDTLTCEAKSGHAPVVFERDNVAAIIQPPQHSHVGIVIGCIAAGAGIALAVVNPAAAVFVALLAAGVWGAIEANPFPHYGPPRPGAHDIVLYQQPGTPLTVTLR